MMAPVPALKTEITEIITGLGALGDDDLDVCLGSDPPPELHNVDGPTWGRLLAARSDGAHDAEFLAAWNNGRALLRAVDGLRGRRPRVVEWKGGHRDPGEDPVPADLRIDHVYLVSCKYLSKVLHNASPSGVFDRRLSGSSIRRGEPNWFDEVAPAEHQELYQLVLRHHADDLELPMRVTKLTAEQRRALRAVIPREWAPECAAAYRRLTAAASTASAARWADGLATARDRTALLWRLLRLGPAPYFVLGTGRGDVLRLRVATPWDWRQAYELRAFEVAPATAGQPQVDWSATVRRREDHVEVEVVGHVEIRWSHGRFGGLPEAKVYLDTPHTRVPGYFPLV